MPVKQRAHKARPHKVTAEAVAAFEAGDFTALHRALGLRPWQPSPLDADTEEPPFTRGALDLWTASWPLARRLRLDLVRAALTIS